MFCQTFLGSHEYVTEIDEIISVTWFDGYGEPAYDDNASLKILRCKKCNKTKGWVTSNGGWIKDTLTKKELESYEL